MIVASAVRLKNGSVFVGKRHSDCFASIMLILKDNKAHIGSMQGFITDELNFLTRVEAYYEALACKQCKETILEDTEDDEKEIWKCSLSSEDLW
jgi:hypothetical protein